MKTRYGFVSNSSSTSFIVSLDRKQEALDFGLELISVRGLKNTLNNISKMGASFIFDYSWTLEELKKLNNDDFITTPFDRDRAYEMGLDFPAFMGDL